MDLSPSPNLAGGRVEDLYPFPNLFYFTLYEMTLVVTGIGSYSYNY